MASKDLDIPWVYGRASPCERSCPSKCDAGGGANCRHDFDGHRQDTLGDGIGSSPGFSRGSSGISAFLTDAHGSA